MSVLLLQETQANCRRGRHLLQNLAETAISRRFDQGAQNEGGLIGYVKSKPLGNGQIISIDVLVDVMIIAVFHKKLI